MDKVNDTAGRSTRGIHIFVKKIIFTLLAAALTFCSVLPASYAADLSLHGFFQGNYSANISSDNPDGGDFKWAEERAQLRLDGSSDPFYLSVKTDVFYDDIDGRADIELREGYADYVAESWDLRAGSQVITWGIGDLVFVNDVFPKDYEAFYAGRPLEYLKKGVDGAKAGLYPSAANIEVVVIPFFEPNSLPREERFRNSMDPHGKKPVTTLENTETALRIYRTIGGHDAALYFYRGFSRIPSMASNGDFFYPELSVYGLSIEGRAVDGILGFEGAYYDSREDRNGLDPFVPNSSTRLLVSHKRQIMEDFNIGLQYYLEYMHEYSHYEETLPSGYPKENRSYHFGTMRLTQFLLHQNLKLSLFLFYSPLDEDYLMNPEVTYKFSDNVWAAVGGIIFGGGDAGRFGRLDKNDNVYVQVRYEF